MDKGLYIHIPFCETRCGYCNFVTTAERSPALRERFFTCFFSEIREARKKHGPMTFDTLYFGGGTPSSLSGPELRRLAEAIRAAFTFEDGFEFTVEFNPGDGEAEKLRALRQFGVNRVSLGCQAFQDRILKRLGRWHTVRDIETAVTRIRDAGISNISFDLMLRLPGQTAEDFKESLRRCVDLGASQVSLYDLEVHAETPFGREHKKGKLELPGEEDHARMYGTAVETLTAAGYEHYEISNFSKPGFASRHNLIYWRNQEYLGLGPGAFTYLAGTRSQLAADLPRYLEKCAAGERKNDTEDKLSDEEKETETFMTGLRLREGVDLSVLPGIRSFLQPRIKALCREGLMERAGERVRMTLKGKSLSEDVFGFLLEKTTIQPRL